jgi:hypothetical protein
MAESFWNIPNDLNIQTPLTVLREQANALTQQTGAALRGDVSTMAFDADIYITMSISVPALNGYKIDILEYKQPVQMYPGTLRLYLGQNVSFVVENETDFIALIREYLSSIEMVRVVRSLLAQAKQA